MNLNIIDIIIGVLIANGITLVFIGIINALFN